MLSRKHEQIESKGDARVVHGCSLCLLGNLLDRPKEEGGGRLVDPEPFELGGDLTAVVGRVITFGACLRRLRKLKGLRQSDFEPVPAKTIARIERGETYEPHGKTLQTIARRLGVAPDEIASY